MLSNYISTKIIQQLPFEPNQEQMNLIDQLSLFLVDQQHEGLFLLKGYAGTGKTSIIGALIKVVDEFKQKAILMAPTGRAAKVFSSYANHPAFTIHKKIFRQKSMTEFSFQLAENLHKHTLFIVDEASMINNSTFGQSVFGSGSLLDDLISYVYSGEGCRLLLLGDDAQLPPIGDNYAPALEKNRLEGYGLQVSHFTLTQVVRQSEKSGILFNATHIRTLINQEEFNKKPSFTLAGFNDIKKLSGEELIDAIHNSYNKAGIENSIIITRSNKRAAIYNKGIRNQVLQKEEELSTGDLLMVGKNNYFWSKNYENLEFIANGDILKIIRIRKHYHLYNLHFVDATLCFLDYEQEIDARLLVDSLYAETPADMELLNKKLFEQVSLDYAEIGNKRERMKQIMENPYYNALQVKFAYAVTCHKAQGGQWDTVFIDQGKLPDELPNNYLNWLYTAFTRSISTLYLVNFEKEYFKTTNFNV